MCKALRQEEWAKQNGGAGWRWGGSVKSPVLKDDFSVKFEELQVSVI